MIEQEAIILICIHKELYKNVYFAVVPLEAETGECPHRQAGRTSLRLSCCCLVCRFVSSNTVFSKLPKDHMIMINH